MKKAHSAMSPGRAEGRGDAGYQVAMHLPRRTSLPKLTQQISKWHISSIEKYWVEWPWNISNWARKGRPFTHFAISTIFSVVEVRISPRRIRNQSKKSCGYGHFFSPLLAPQATHSKILAPGGANTAMAYQKTNSFFPRPPIPSGERTSPPLDHSPPLVSKRADLRIYFVMLTCPTHRYTQTPTKITSTRPQLSEIHHLKDHHRLDSTGWIQPALAATTYNQWAICTDLHKSYMDCTQNLYRNSRSINKIMNRISTPGWSCPHGHIWKNTWSHDTFCDIH